MRRLAAIGALAVALFAFGMWTQRPFRLELARCRTSMMDRTSAQRENLRQGVARLNGAVLEPGEVFSFNRWIGPRTPERGYRLAAAYLEQDVTQSLGGGLCQLSSTLYDAALAAGLTIAERHAHQRRVSSVPPGRDAAVWYGKTDLRLVNPTAWPIRLDARVVDEGLEVEIRGARSVASSIRVWAEPMAAPPGWLGVQVWREFGQDGRASRVSVSQDRYPVR